MGNLFPLGMLNIPCIRLCRTRKVIQIVRMDGKMVEFKKSITVKELLINFHGFAVKLSRNSLNNLPPNSELRLGKVYYLVPAEETNDPNSSQHLSTESVGEGETKKPTVKRIKVLITKKQLQELLSNKISLEKIMLRIDKSSSCDSSRNWKPSLTCIPEENELS